MKADKKSQTAAKPTRKSSPASRSPKKAAPLAPVKPQATLRRRKYQHASIKQPTLQNPIIEYFEARIRHPHHKKRPKTPRHLRIERKILAMLACFSISIGLWENFRQLWLQGNSFSATDVSNIISLGMVASVVGILLVRRLVKMEKIKLFMTATLIVRSVNLLLLFFLNGSSLTFLIDLCSIIDVLAGALIIASVYPLLTTVLKSNNAYSRRKLVEYLFRDIGILIGDIIIGQQLGGFVIDYNACLMVAVLFSVAASIILAKTEIRVMEKTDRSKFSVLKFILRSKLQRTYMIYVFLAGTAFTTAVGLKMLILTDRFMLSPGLATNYLLLVGLAADLIGIAALKYFTPKNDYITISIKFGARLLIFAGAFLSNSLFLCFIALTWTLLSSTAYENITDGYYINSVDNRHQLKYNTTKNVVTYAGDALGMFLCGQMFEIGTPFIFGLAALLLVFQIAVAFYLIYLRHRLRKH